MLNNFCHISFSLEGHEKFSDKHSLPFNPDYTLVRLYCICSYTLFLQISTYNYMCTFLQKILFLWYRQMIQTLNNQMIKMLLGLFNGALSNTQPIKSQIIK